jgi:hypothetical protein
MEKPPTNPTIQLNSNPYQIHFPITDPYPNKQIISKSLPFNPPSNKNTNSNIKYQKKSRKKTQKRKRTLKKY